MSHADEPIPVTARVPGPSQGRVCGPGDTSIPHGTVILGLLASGETGVTGGRPATRLDRIVAGRVHAMGPAARKPMGVEGGTTIATRFPNVGALMTGPGARIG